MTRPENPPPLPRPPEVLRREHHDYLVDLERRGLLFAAGPFVDEKGNRVGLGMIVIRAKSTAAARRVALAEPYTKAGQRVMTVTPWQRNEGSLRLSVSFAAGELAVDGRRYAIAPAGDE